VTPPSQPWLTIALVCLAGLAWHEWRERRRRPSRTDRIAAAVAREVARTRVEHYVPPRVLPLAVRHDNDLWWALFCDDCGPLVGHYRPGVREDSIDALIARLRHTRHHVEQHERSMA
jgi:hypothetical protein